MLHDAWVLCFRNTPASYWADEAWQKDVANADGLKV
ncbi:hypothetical protein GJW-30_1_02041 [Variibacter gotjawalensis]|uniref:Uncharacterized protein n=1 Tax=Variibacter gotjawalensis TaxID=1333996 RepID=A0A0S3PUG0_9BRAD|nr:hypothetical protein [Variibacter gotjawalensis]RZS45832.1 hypothetical protein EV661_4158 [Variibacter gotjawalensis]BAT59508.1 hypothetical protein GJW-30_1_02041 [Variibacter gotjawalensis]